MKTDVETVQAATNDKPDTVNPPEFPSRESASVATQQRLDVPQREKSNYEKLQERLDAIQEIDNEVRTSFWNATENWNTAVWDAARCEFELTEAQEREINQLSNHDLHEQTFAARNEYFVRCTKTRAFAAHRLIPLCDEIIRRFKMPGVAAKDRPNGQPTVDAYFKSIGLNYNTVRSWFYRDKWTYRDKLNRAMFDDPGWIPPDMRIEKDSSLYARCLNDLGKIKSLAEKINFIGESHTVRLRDQLDDLLMYAGQLLAAKYELSISEKECKLPSEGE
jgi:hypothetical protein